MGKEAIQTAFEVAKYAGIFNPKKYVADKRQQIKETVTDAVLMKARESILTEIPLDYPDDFDQVVAERYAEKDESGELKHYFALVLGTHKAHVAGFPAMKVAERIKNIKNRVSGKQKINGSLLLVASNMANGQNDTITESFQAVQPILDKLQVKTQGVLRKKDREHMERKTMVPILREQKIAIQEAIESGLIPISLPEGTVQSGRQKKDGKPGEIYGMMPLEAGSVTYLANIIENLGMEPLFFFVGNTGENRIYDPNTEHITTEAKIKGALRLHPKGRKIIKSIMHSVIDYPTSLREIKEALGVEGKLAPRVLEQYCGERLNQLIPHNERGNTYNNPQLLDQAPQIRRRATEMLFRSSDVVFQR